MATQVSLNDGAVASAGALAIQTNGTTQAVSISTGQVATFAQNPILTSGTANGVAYLNGSKVLTTGSALTFDGTNFATTGAGTFSGLLSRIHAQGTDAYITNTTTGKANTVMGFNDSGSTTAQGIPTGYAYYGTLQSYPVGFTSGGYLTNSISSTAHIWNTTGSEQMRLTSTGLGIGTSSPAFKLDVASTQAVFRLTSTSGINPVYLLTSNGGGDFYFGRENSTGSTFGSNTGYASVLYSAGAYPIVFLPNGTERMRLDSSGNLGLGVTPSAWRTAGGEKAIQIGTSLTAYSNSGGDVYWNKNWFINSSSQSIYLNNGYAQSYGMISGEHRWYISPSGTAGNAITFTQAMTLDASGNLLVGTTSSLQTNVGIRAYIDRGGISGYDSLAVTSSQTTNTESCYDLYSTGASAYRFYVGLGGTIFATSTTITAISDQRLKENIRDLDDGLASVMALKPRKFDWKEGKGANIKDARGFIAQEFETVFPDMIDEWKDPAPEGEEPYKAINANLIPTLVKAIQELKAEIDSLKSQLNGA